MPGHTHWGLRHFVPEVSVNILYARQPALNFAGARGRSLAEVPLTVEINHF